MEENKLVKQKQKYERFLDYSNSQLEIINEVVKYKSIYVLVKDSKYNTYRIESIDVMNIRLEQPSTKYSKYPKYYLIAYQNDQYHSYFYKLRINRLNKSWWLNRDDAEHALKIYEGR